VKIETAISLVVVVMDALEYRKTCIGGAQKDLPAELLTAALEQIEADGEDTVVRIEQPAVMRRKTISGGTLTWRNRLGERILSVGYWLEFKAEDQRVVHLAQKVEADGTETRFVEPILLSSTVPNFGGVRWWFICPLIEDGLACKRRVKKLFLPPGETYFGCRACYRLTYESAQSHDARVDKLMKNPWALVMAVESKNPSRSLLGIQAYFKLRGAL
jgi:hypothetical protein